MKNGRVLVILLAAYTWRCSMKRKSYWMAWKYLAESNVSIFLQFSTFSETVLVTHVYFFNCKAIILIVDNQENKHWIYSEIQVYRIRTGGALQLWHSFNEHWKSSHLKLSSNVNANCLDKLAMQFFNSIRMIFVFLWNVTNATLK